MPRYFWNWFKRRLFVGAGVKLGARFHIGVGSFVSTPARLGIGDDVYIGKYCSVQCSGTIGSHVLIANNVGIVGRRDHDIRQVGVPIRSARSVSNDKQLAQDPRNWIVIEDDVWIGFGAVVLTGLRIGRGAIVGAGSVVFDDVPDFAIVSGNPAVVVGQRFPKDAIPLHIKGTELKRYARQARQ